MPPVNGTRDVVEIRGALAKMGRLRNGRGEFPLLCAILNYLFIHYTNSFQSNEALEMAAGLYHTVRWAMHGAIDRRLAG